MDENEELLGATAAPSDQPPPWLQMLLDHQSKQLKQLLTPVLQHVAAEQRETSRAAHPTISSQIPNPGAGLPPLMLQETPEPPSVQPHTSFTAELEVIRQKSCNAGPSNTSAFHDPTVRRRVGNIH